MIICGQRHNFYIQADDTYVFVKILPLDSGSHNILYTRKYSLILHQRIINQYPPVGSGLFQVLKRLEERKKLSIQIQKNEVSVEEIQKEKFQRLWFPKTCWILKCQQLLMGKQGSEILYEVQLRKMLDRTDQVKGKLLILQDEIYFA